MERRAAPGARPGARAAAPRGLCLQRTRLAAFSSAEASGRRRAQAAVPSPAAAAAAPRAVAPSTAAAALASWGQRGGARAVPSSPRHRPTAARRALPDDAEDAEYYDEDEEEEGEEEEGFIDAEAQDIASAGDEQAAAADDNDNADPSSLPEPPQRALPAWELLSRAGHASASRRLRDRCPDLLVFDVCDDPRRVAPGDAFVCRTTLRDGCLWDGHDHAAAAAAAGAALIVAERPLDTDGAPLDVVGCPREGEEQGEAWRRQREQVHYSSFGPLLRPPHAPVPSNVPVVVVPDADDAAGALASALYDWPSLRMRVVAVAGSSGKTTAGWLVRAILEEAGQLTGMIGSVEHAVGDVRLDPRTGRAWVAEEEDPTAGRESSAPFMLPPWRGRYPSPSDASAPGAAGGGVATTPDPILLQRLLAGMADRGATAAVVEATAEALALGYCDWLQPDVALVTRVDPRESPESAEAVGGNEAYVSLHAEGWLSRVLTDAGAQRAVINLDDPAAKRMLAAVAATGGVGGVGGVGGEGEGGEGGEPAPSSSSSSSSNRPPVPVLTYALDDPSADVWAERVELSLWETRLVVRTPAGRLELIADVVGRSNARHVLAAVATGVALGVPLERIGAGVEAAGPVPGRGEVVDRPERDAPFAIVVDAADTPKRIEAVLRDVREAGARRVFAVFGCEGEKARRDLRAACGAALHAGADFVVFTNASPKREDPAAVVADLVSGLPEEVTAPYAGWVYAPFQDQGRVPLWFEPFVHAAQRKARRYVMEDRFSAIRAAVGTAKAEDAVVILGRGDRDWVEHWGGDWGGGAGNDDEEGGAWAGDEFGVGVGAAAAGTAEGDLSAAQQAGGRQRGGLIARGWLDDRAEARSALSRLHYIAAVKGLDRSELPWRGEREASTSAANASAGGIARVVELLK